MKIRGGYIKLDSFIKTTFKEEEVLFNIKSIFTVFRYHKTNNSYKHHVELMYGKDQILCHLSKFPREFIVYDAKSTHCSVCKDGACFTDLKIIGTVSKKIFCLKTFKPEHTLKESFILVNEKRKVNGVVL